MMKPQAQNEITALISGMSNLTVSLKALKWVAWNAHWAAHGSNSYSDHLLMERIYSKVDDMVDVVVENIIGYSNTCGISLDQATWAISVEELTLGCVKALLKGRSEINHECVLKAVGAVRTNCAEIMSAYNKLNSSSVVLGVEDYIPGIAKKAENFSYLLMQRGKYNG